MKADCWYMLTSRRVACAELERVQTVTIVYKPKAAGPLPTPPCMHSSARATTPDMMLTRIWATSPALIHASSQLSARNSQIFAPSTILCSGFEAIESISSIDSCFLLAAISEAIDQ